MSEEITVEIKEIDVLKSFNRDQKTNFVFETMGVIQEVLKSENKDDNEVMHLALSWIHEALEELTQLRARLAQLNEPFIDPTTGDKHHQCSPYNVERLKHAMNYHMNRAADLEKRLALEPKAQE